MEVSNRFKGLRGRECSSLSGTCARDDGTIVLCTLLLVSHELCVMNEGWIREAESLLKCKVIGGRGFVHKAAKGQLEHRYLGEEGQANLSSKAI